MFNLIKPNFRKKEQLEIKALNAQSLESVLEELENYGRPRISQMQDRKWFTRVEMNVNIKGAEYLMSSDFNHPTPLSAALACLDRVKEAVK